MFFWQSWAWRKNQRVGEGPTFFRPIPVPDHRDLGPQTLQIVGEVPSEGIVVVEQGDAHEV